MHSTSASLISPKHRGYDIKEDHIYIFLNYNQLFKTKVKKEALSFIDKMINEAPIQVKADLHLYKDYLLKSIN